MEARFQVEGELQNWDVKGEEGLVALFWQGTFGPLLVHADLVWGV